MLPLYAGHFHVLPQRSCPDKIYVEHTVNIRSCTLYRQVLNSVSLEF